MIPLTERLDTTAKWLATSCLAGSLMLGIAASVEYVHLGHARQVEINAGLGDDQAALDNASRLVANSSKALDREGLLASTLFAASVGLLLVTEKAYKDSTA